LLMLGGAYLCFEGAEKLAHKLLPHDAAEGEPSSQVVPDDLVAFEQQKVKGAIRTDFILSAEIIVIALGTVQGSSLGLQISVVAGIALLMTVGVYGLVGLIVKLDDIGLHLLQKSDGSALRRAVGQGLLVTAPRLMHLLALVGTIAMFMVGGGILVHGWPFAHHLIEGAAGALATLPTVGTVLAAITPTLLNAVAGVVTGLLLVLAMTLVSKLKPAR
jgi:predicted DNA repair protein MutK